MKNQYKGTLDPKSASEGILAAYKNAESLLNDAELLFTNGRYQRCFALSILAIEEAGKAGIIRGMLVLDDQKDLKKQWQAYRSHTSKNRAWILPQLAANGASELDDLKEIFRMDSDHGYLLDNLKQLALYTDKFSANSWSTPEGVIDKELAYKLFLVARSLVVVGKVMTSERELEIWIKHLKPVWNQDLQLMKLALVNSYKESFSEGLIEEWQLKEMINFIKFEYAV